jgi:hypothetical protein
MTSTNNPDGDQSGRMIDILQQAFRSISSPLEVRGLRVEKNRRFCQVFPYPETGLFGYDLWDRGVMLGDAGTTDPVEAARCIHAWVEGMATPSQIKRLFPFVTLRPIAEPFENDREVEWEWGEMEQAARKYMPALVPLVVAARERQELRDLFPFTSHECLCLSRCTGYPFSGDCPSAVPAGGGQYTIFVSGREVGRGDAQRAGQMLIDHLPTNCGPARKGTSDDL